jgi:hypothetical protein
MSDLLLVNTLDMRDTAEICDCCGEELCTICGEHWGDCEHPSEMMEDDYEYHTIDGILYAKPL